MRDIAVATKSLPTAKRLSFMKDVFDVRGMMSGMSLTKEVKELDAFLAKLKDVFGQADATAKAMDAAIRDGDKDALTGGKTEHEQLEDKVSQGREEKHASSDEADSAEKKAAEIEKRLIRETRSELENEVSDIKELRDEYKALIETMLAYEKSSSTLKKPPNSSRTEPAAGR